MRGGGGCVLCTQGRGEQSEAKRQREIGRKPEKRGRHGSEMEKETGSEMGAQKGEGRSEGKETRSKTRSKEKETRSKMRK